MPGSEEARTWHCGIQGACPSPQLASTPAALHCCTACHMTPSPPPSLQIEALDAQQTNIQLGFPATLTHIVRPGSPLYNLSLEEMRTRMMEIIVFVDGVDSMTSKMMQVGGLVLVGWVWGWESCFGVGCPAGCQ
jgi:hypothetical protein